jgi:hypothetical protein
MHEMVSTWQAESDVGFIIAGHTSFERLSAIADIIKESAVTGTDCPYSVLASWPHYSRN